VGEGKRRQLLPAGVRNQVAAQGLHVEGRLSPAREDDDGRTGERVVQWTQQHRPDNGARART